MHRLGAVTLRQLGAVRSVDQGDVGEGRARPAQRIVDQALARGVVQMIVAANDVGHSHVVVVHDDGEIIGRRAVRTQQHQIVQVVGRPVHVALDLIGHRDRRRLWPTEAHDVRQRQVVHGRLTVAPRRFEGALFSLGLVTQTTGLLGRGEVAVGVASFEQLIDHLAVAVGAAVLEHRLFVGEQFQPAQTVEDGLHRLVGRTFAVGILDPDQETPCVSLGVQPVE